MLKSILLTLTLAALCQSAAAYGLLSNQARDQKIKEFVYLDAESARADYENKFDNCFKESLKKPISIEIFKKNNISLTNREAKYALIYIYERNFINCIGDTSHKYLVALDTAKHYGVTDFPKYSIPDLSIKIMKYKADYLEISKEKREVIEKIPDLQTLLSLKK